MKKVLLAFLNKPLLVMLLCLSAALAIGTVGYRRDVAFRRTLASTVIAPASSTALDAPAEQLSLAFLTSGTIGSVAVKEGDRVHKGEVLASLAQDSTAGALTEAKAAYAAAQAAYEKVLNGATGPTIDVAKAAVATAQSALDTVTTQQDALVANAKRKLYSDDLVAVSNDKTRRAVAPAVSGIYNGSQAGSYHLYFVDANDIVNRNQVSFTGLENGTADVSDAPQPLGTQGLFISFPTTFIYLPTDSWTIDIPNESGMNYVTDLNTYQSALQNQNQALAAAQAALDQAQASLSLTVAAARPEDVTAAQAQIDSAKGALQMAQAAYDNRVLISPMEAVVTAVHISAGQVAVPNVPAIEISALAQSPAL